MDYPKISLKAINDVNLRDCIRLKVADDQAAFVATNTQSLAQAYVNPKLTPLAIYDGALIVTDTEPDHRMVGFVDNTWAPPDDSNERYLMLDWPE